MNAFPSAFVRAIIAASAAAVLVVLDAFTWLMTIFALSGPILLSAIYEAFLDSRLLNYVNDERRWLTAAQRTRLLYIILVGNLDMNADGDEEDINNGPWNRIDGRTQDDECLLKELKTDCPLKAHVDTTETHLRTMLASQYSFGVTVGAPVVFFCASFVYTLIDNFSNLGDNDTSHALGESALQIYEAHSTKFCSIWHVVDGDTAHSDHQWTPTGRQQPKHSGRSSE